LGEKFPVRPNIFVLRITKVFKINMDELAQRVLWECML